MLGVVIVVVVTTFENFSIIFVCVTTVVLTYLSLLILFGEILLLGRIKVFLGRVGIGHNVRATDATHAESIIDTMIVLIT